MNKLLLALQGPYHLGSRLYVYTNILISVNPSHGCKSTLALQHYLTYYITRLAHRHHVSRYEETEDHKLQLSYFTRVVYIIIWMTNEICVWNILNDTVDNMHSTENR